MNRDKLGDTILGRFISGPYFTAWHADNQSFGGGIILSDPARFDRVVAGSEYGDDWSTNAEIIGDWRDAWALYMLDRGTAIRRVDAAVRAAIVRTREWHRAAGTLH